MTAPGKLEKVIPDTEGFLENYSFVRDHFGRMYWAERTNSCQTIVRRNTDNTVTRLGSICFDNIRKIESLPDGSVILMDFQDMKKIDAQGRLTTIAAKIADKRWTKSNAENQNSVMGIWADTQGNLYAAVSSARMVKKFSRDGKEEVAFTTSFPWTPSGGMIDARGNLWVLECSVTNAVRVEKVGADKRGKVY